MSRRRRTLPRLALLAALAAVPAAAAPRSDACLRGVNLAGAEFGALPGTPDRDYTYPSEATVAHFAATGMTVIRLPFRWPRLQPALRADLDPAELARLEAAVRRIRAAGLAVVLDLHDYGRYRDVPVGSAAVPNEAFADLWSRLARRFKADDGVVFGLMNEPHDMPARQWLGAANAAMAAIRKAGAKNLVLVPGTDWTGVHSWFGAADGRSNAEVMAGVVDPAGRFAYDVHQYMDADFSGTKPECSRAGDAVAAVDRLSEWLAKTGRRAFLGEFAAPRDPACVAALETLVARLDARPDAWIGWSYWAAGDWWAPDYPFSLQPADGADRPQMTALKPSLGKPARCPR